MSVRCLWDPKEGKPSEKASSCRGSPPPSFTPSPVPQAPDWLTSLAPSCFACLGLLSECLI